MPQRILIMGLPGAGKTYLAQHILDHLQAEKKQVMGQKRTICR
jgi:adenylate kinase family enzyme